MIVTVDGRRVEAAPGDTILAAAARAGVYVPTLCWHPGLEGIGNPASAAAVWQGTVERRGTEGVPFGGCDLCAIEVDGMAGLHHACWVKAQEGMVIRTGSPTSHEGCQAAFARILGSHPHSCLVCRQKDGCAREPCSLGVPAAERCCPKLGRCAIEGLHGFLQFSSPLPSYVRDDRLTCASPLFAFDWNLCVGCMRCVRACAGLRQVGALGFTVEGARVRVGFRRPTPEEAGCRFCGACAQVCPTGAILDLPSPRLRQAGQAGKRTLVPCRDECPASLDVPAYVRAVAQGEAGLAARIVREGTPLGRVLGRICHAPCQNACRRGAITEPVSICAVKRFACDTAGPELPRVARPTGKRVAVVGGGPAGLTAAWFLARKGHRVTVFEEQKELGGMLRWGIPPFRLPRDVVREEIDQIVRLGVQVKASTRVTDPGALRKDFDALLLATGLPASRTLPVPGADAGGIRYGLDFLREASSGRGARPGPGDEILVIGGGNVAVDSALTALRLGTRRVTVVCLEAEGQMPAFAWELEKARAEGVRILAGWGPARIFSPACADLPAASMGRLPGAAQAGASAGRRGARTACEFVRCVSVFDERGRFAPRFDESERMTLEADGIVAAIGQRRDEAVQVAPDPEAGVFSAGDVAGGALSVVDAVASAKTAAAQIDRFLGGDGSGGEEGPRAGIPGAIGKVEDFASLRAVVPACEEAGFTAEEARREASRCLQCGLRLALGEAPFPPAGPSAGLGADLAELTADATTSIPDKEGVLLLFGPDREILQIGGTPNLRAEARKYASHEKVRFFAFEVDPFYTKRESELLQAHLARHGRLPPGVESIEDLY